MFAPHLAWRDAGAGPDLRAGAAAGGDGPRRELGGLGRVPTGRRGRLTARPADRARHRHRRRPDHRRRDLPRRTRCRPGTGPPDRGPGRTAVPVRQARLLGALLLRHGAGRDRAGGWAAVGRPVPGGLDADEVTGTMVAMAATEGDPVAAQAVGELGHWLAVGLALVTDVLDPEVIVVGGGVSGAAGMFLPRRARSSPGLITGAGHRPLPRVELARFGDRAGIIGAESVGPAGTGVLTRRHAHLRLQPGAVVPAVGLAGSAARAPQPGQQQAEAAEDQQQAEHQRGVRRTVSSGGPARNTTPPTSRIRPTRSGPSGEAAAAAPAARNARRRASRSASRPAPR